MMRIFPFSCACACSENEMLLKHNTTRGNVCSMKALDPDYLAPKQFSKMAKGSDDFACACVCVEFRFHLGHSSCMRLYLRR